MNINSVPIGPTITIPDKAEVKIEKIGQTDGFDSHSLRAYSYFGDEMEGIDPDSVESINEIAVRYKSLRQKSKAPTFALQYLGTYRTLMANCGFTERLAKQIEKRYREMYAVSFNYTDKKLAEACKKGYVTVAFGLRVRTPSLKNSVLGTRRTPQYVQAEARSAANALSQSYGQLTNRAAHAFMSKVRDSKYRKDIKICCQIHDAAYFLVRDRTFAPLMFLNENMAKEMQWQEDPAIQHPEVGLSGSTEIYWPNWAHGFSIANDATETDIKKAIKKHRLDLIYSTVGR